MKKKTFIMGLAALALAFGSAGVIGGVSLSANDSAVMTRAEEAAETDSLVFTGKCNGSGTSTNNVAWTITSDATESSFDNNYGIHYGTSSAEVEYITLTSGTYTRKITKITVSARNASDTNTTVSATVGGAAFGSTVSLVKASANSDCVFTGEEASGVVVVSVKKATSSKKALYVKSITIEFANEPSVTVDGGSDITVVAGSAKTVSLKAKYMPTGGSLAASITDESVATASISDSSLTINAGANVGETTYKISMKDASGNEVASCSGKIIVSIAVTEVTLSSTFSNGDTLRIGKTYSLNTAVAPSNASQEVVWTISDPDAVTISSENVLSIVKKTGTDAITISATSAADSTKSATLSFYVTNDFAISELLSQDGSTLPNGLTKDTSVVATAGTVTAIENTHVYIQSGASAIMLFTYNDVLSSLKIGDGVRASGTITIFNGITELSNPTATVDENVKETITPLELTADGMIAANTSRLVSAYGAKCLATTEISGTKNIEVSFELSNGTPFKVYIKKDLISTVSSSFGNFTENSYYDIKGIYCLYKGTTSQIIIDEGCFYYPAGTEEVKKFIADYITGKDGEPAEGDTCKAKYDAAKAAYDKLSDNAKTLFTTGTDYAEAYATYTYWETHQSSANSAKLVNNSSSTDWTSLAVIGGALLLAAGACVYFFYNKKKKQDR